MDIKCINDYENSMKILLKEFKNKKIEIDNEIEFHKNIINMLKKIMIILTTIFSLTTIIIPSPSFILLILNIVALSVTTFTVIRGNKTLNKLEKIKILSKNEINDECKIIDNVIDSCELLKSYLRGKNLTSDELTKIITFLYLEFGFDLKDVLSDIAFKNNSSVEQIDKDNIKFTEITNNLESENISPKNDEMRRILKR